MEQSLICIANLTIFGENVDAIWECLLQYYYNQNIYTVAKTDGWVIFTAR